MPGNEEAQVHGIDLSPLGWQDLRDSLDLIEGQHLDKRLDNYTLVSMKVVTQTHSDGSTTERFALSSGERNPNGSMIAHSYTVVDGMLTCAGVLDFVPGEKGNKERMEYAFEADKSAGLLDPSEDDAKALIQILGKAAGRS